jgi:transposase
MNTLHAYIEGDILNFIDKIENIINNKTELLSGSSVSKLSEILNSEYFTIGVENLIKLRDTLKETEKVLSVDIQQPEATQPKINPKKEIRIKYILDNLEIKTANEIATDLNLSYQTILNLYKELGVKLRKGRKKYSTKNVEPKQKQSKVLIKKNIRINYIQEYYKTQTILEISKALDVDHQTIRKLYKELGLKPFSKQKIEIQPEIQPEINPIKTVLKRGRKSLLSDSLLSEFIIIATGGKIDAYDLGKKFGIKTQTAYQIAKNNNMTLTIKNKPKGDEFIVYNHIKGLLKYNSHTSSYVYLNKIVSDLNIRYNFSKEFILGIIEKYFDNKKIIID